MAKGFRSHRLRANGSLKLLMIRPWDRRGRAIKADERVSLFFLFHLSRYSTFADAGDGEPPEMFDLPSNVVSANWNNEKSSRGCGKYVETWAVSEMRAI